MRWRASVRRLVDDVKKLPGARILDGRFASVQQAIGTRRANEIGARFLGDYAMEIRKSGLVANLIAQFAINGLSVARGEAA